MTTPLSRAAARIIRQQQAINHAADAEAKAAAKADAFIQQIMTATPAQVSSYIDANVTDLASARTFLKRITVGLIVLLRREYRD